MKHLGILAIICSSTLFLACSEKIPEVNDENCKSENIEKIKDDTLRAEFSTKCFRSGEVKATGRDKGF
ncbi:entry exclusion lipoprotein TrbK [Acinetobacter baumannii]|uniref:entry exclusion lipoprotein TrbK n=1 Tax=Acinetobacter baumannii TaxID=470 RepID=UPI00233EA2F4|nr:entry exclusion lipoprotein TrbK [Acinetobacter baumannii]MDC4524108.1 entry exclusion lipoprotein TrbK [Acinetobacter baumannii]MDC4689215.1 entry exclusion lipoprotein TrbK [Acinetobacter baumannii]MDC4987640.1 entry exclusion lipoprotein TrbK [Acinetobacter baumannii]MDC5002011.1 entry exclusion lipoprotein TrbK [Acinetobacter baumannii]